jgi:hypothetical protein
MRLRSTIAVMCVLPPSVVMYAWMCEKKIHVAGPVVALFIAGFSALWVSFHFIFLDITTYRHLRL